MGTPAATGSYDLQFVLKDSATGGSTLWSETQTGVSVQQGTFSVILGSVTLLSLPFDLTYYLEVTATAGPGISSPVTFSPRSEFTSAPYAFRADTAEYAKAAPGGGGGPYLPLAGGAMTGAITSTGDPEITMGKANFGTGNLNTGTQAFVAGSYNRARGNYSVVGGGGGATAADSNSASGYYTTIAGGRRNKTGDDEATVGGGALNNASAYGSLIAGGGGNTATHIFSTVGGGALNNASGYGSLIAGGEENTASGDWSTVGGGANNTSSYFYTAIGGGWQNSATATSSTVAGGLLNHATGLASTVGGGASNKARGQYSVVSGGGGGVNEADSNSASGDYAVIPGGRSNKATGRYSYAAGWKAKSNHTGTFVWADSTGASGTDFTSTAANQFLIRASGGVGIGTASPAQQLDVAGTAQMTGFKLPTGASNGYLLTSDASGVGTWQAAPSSGGWTDDGSVVRLSTSGDNVGIGTTSPSKKLEVSGSARVTDTLFASNVSSNSPLHLQTGGTTRVYVDDATGRVGIGTTSPSTILHIAGTSGEGLPAGSLDLGLLISNNITSATQSGIRIIAGSSTYGRLSFGDNSSAEQGVIKYDNSTDAMEFTTNGTTRAFIDLQGRFGIGTTSPVNKLDIEGGAVIGATYSGTNTAPSNGLLVEGNVGIGTTSSTARLTIQQNASREIEFSGSADDVEIAGTSNINLGTTNTSDLNLLTNNTVQVALDGATGRVGIGDITPDAKLDVEESGATVGAFNRTTNDGTVIAILQDGTTEGTISVSGTTVSYNAFTGSHFGWSDESIEQGTLVSLTGVNRRYHDDSNSEIIYGITPSSKANDPACMGAYLGLQESSLPASNENPHLIMAVGNGEMWVTNEGGDIQPGDFLISSNTSGCAMKYAPEKYPIGYIVARAAEGVNWKDGAYRKKVSVFFKSFMYNGETLHLKEEISNLKAEVHLMKTILNRFSTLDENRKIELSGTTNIK